MDNTIGYNRWYYHVGKIIGKDDILVIGIIPTQTKTFTVESFFNEVKPEEGKLYIDPDTKRVFMYSLIEKRSNPNTGYFPIWNGIDKIVSKFSHDKYLDTDVKITDIKLLCSSIDKDVADGILYQRRRSINGNILEPVISDGDNMFTQCVKGVLASKKYTLVDLVDMSKPKLDDKIIHNYYSALTKITFMRLDKWIIWIDSILHVRYDITVYNEGKKLLVYDYPSNTFDTGIVKYDNITNLKDDQFKKIIKILIIMENINKNSLRSEEVDDYTINNMLTTLNSKKLLSSQLFSRFIRMANLSYEVHVFDNDGFIFQYGE